MNRALRFRAWDTKLKKMIFTGFHLMGEVMAFHLIEQHCFETKGKGTSLDRWNDIEVTQFIGLRDINGKDIYEGDIVKWDDNSKGRYWRVCEIKWEKAHYALFGYTFDTDKPNDKTDVDFKFGAFIYEYDGALEVIGNIYENPELLTNNP